MKQYHTLTLLVLGGLLLSACASGNAQAAESTSIPPVIAEDVVVAEGRVEPVRYAHIAFVASGVVGEVLVEEGEHVTEGQVIARLSNSEAKQAEVARAEEELLTAQRGLDSGKADALKEMADAYEQVRLAQIALDDFDIPSDFKDLTPAEAVEQTLEKVEKARTDYEPYRDFSRRPPTRAEYMNKEYGFKDYTHYDQTARMFKKRLDDAWADYKKSVRWTELEADLQAAQARADQARVDYENLQSNIDSQTATAEARFNTALTSLKAAQAALADLELRAPFSGTLANLDLRPGESVTAGEQVASVADFSAWVVKTTDLTEIDVVDIETGQETTVTLDAIPDQQLAGVVRSIGQTYTEEQGDILYEAAVTLKDVPPQIRWGMTAEIKLPR